MPNAQSTTGAANRKQTLTKDDPPGWYLATDDDGEKMGYWWDGTNLSGYLDRHGHPVMDADHHSLNDFQGPLVVAQEPTISLDAPEAWIRAAQEAVQYVNCYLVGKCTGLEEAKEKLGGLLYFIEHCKPIAPDVTEVLAEVTPLRAELERITALNREADNRREKAEAELQKITDYLYTEPSEQHLAELRELVEGLPVKLDAEFAVMLLRNRNRFLSEKNEALAKLQASYVAAINDKRDAEQSRDSGKAVISAFTKALSAISEIALGSSSAWSESEDADGTGLETLVEAVKALKTEAARAPDAALIEKAILAVDTIHGYGYFREGQDGFGGLAWLRRLIERVSPPKTAFELPPPGTKFKAEFSTGKVGEFYRFANGKVFDQYGEEWDESQFEHASLVE